MQAQPPPSCPVAAAGERVLQASKQLLAAYEGAKGVAEGNDEGLKGAAGRLGDRWPTDVQRLRSLLDVGYRKAQDDVAAVLRGQGGGHGGGKGEVDDDGRGYDNGGAGGARRPGGDADGQEQMDVFFTTGKEREAERERFNVTQALCDGARGVRRLSRSLPPE